MLSYEMNKYEASIVNVIRTIGFGELLVVHSRNDDVIVSRELLPSPFRSFFRELKEVGRFDRVKIHEGRPTYAEKQYIIDGIEVIQKFKFI